MTQDQFPGPVSDELAREYIRLVLDAGRAAKPGTDWRLSAPTEHYTELQPLRPDEPLAAAWEVYRREVGRLLAEGHEGEFVLIGLRGELAGLYDTYAAAVAEGQRRFPGERVLAHEVLEHHPIIRLGRAGAWLGRGSRSPATG